MAECTDRSRAASAVCRATVHEGVADSGRADDELGRVSVLTPRVSASSPTERELGTDLLHVRQAYGARVKTGIAPCGHPGTYVTNTFITCNQRCEFGPAHAAREPGHVDMTMELVELPWKKMTFEQIRNDMLLVGQKAFGTERPDTLLVPGSLYETLVNHVAKWTAEMYEELEKQLPDTTNELDRV
jgi:hypothetical protein